MRYGYIYSSYFQSRMRNPACIYFFGERTMRKTLVGWLIWFLAAAALTIFLNAAEQGARKQSEGSAKRPPVQYHYYMD